MNPSHSKLPKSSVHADVADDSGLSTPNFQLSTLNPNLNSQPELNLTEHANIMWAVTVFQNFILWISPQPKSNQNTKHVILFVQFACIVIVI